MHHPAQTCVLSHRHLALPPPHPTATSPHRHLAPAAEREDRADRAASGAAEQMPLIRVVNLSRSIGVLQDYGFFVAGLDARGDGDIASLASQDRLAIVLGSEGSGLRHLTREKADRLIQIPMEDAAESLNVSNAAAVALYAVYAGRKQA